MPPTFLTLAKAKAIVIDRGVTHGTYFTARSDAPEADRCAMCFVAAVAIAAGFERPDDGPFPLTTPVSYLAETHSEPLLHALYAALGSDAPEPAFRADRDDARRRAGWIGLIDWFDGEFDGRPKSQAEAIEVLQRAANAAAATRPALDDIREDEKADVQQGRPEDAW